MNAKNDNIKKLRSVNGKLSTSRSPNKKNALKESNPFLGAEDLASFEKIFQGYFTERGIEEVARLMKYVQTIILSATPTLYLSTPLQILLQEVPSNAITSIEVVPNLREYEIYAALGLHLVADRLTRPIEKKQDENSLQQDCKLLGQLFELSHITLKLQAYWNFLDAASTKIDKVHDHGASVGVDVK